MKGPLQMTLGCSHGIDMQHLSDILRANGYRIEYEPPGFPLNYWIIDRTEEP